MTRSAWLPIAVAAVLHIGLALSVPPRFEIDSAFYRTQAENLARTGASLDADGRPETRYTPGYPLFLAAFLASGLGYSAAMAAQHAIWIALTAAAMWLARSRSMLAACVAGLVTTLDLPGVQASISVLSETLAAATLTASVCCALLSIRSSTRAHALRWALLSGALAGATALVRPIALLLGVPLAVAIVIGSDRPLARRSRLAAAAALLAVFAILPALWTIRNARQTGAATLSTLASINLLHYRAAGTLAIRDPGGIDANLATRRGQLEQLACRNLEASYRRPCHTLTWAERAGEYARIAWPVILGDPAASARQAIRALGMIVLGGSANLLAEVTGIDERTTRVVSLLYTVPLAVLAVFGIPYWWTRDRALAALLLLVIAYMFAMALGAEAYSRFRVPVIALYAVLCGGGAAFLRARVDGSKD